MGRVICGASLPGAVGTKCYHSFKWHAIRLFNSLPQHLRNLTNCSVHMFKNRLDKYLSTLLDDPTLAYNDNYGQSFFPKSIIIAWNGLAQEIAEADTLDLFKSKLAH